jgi:hypothetical protein
LSIEGYEFIEKSGEVEEAAKVIKEAAQAIDVLRPIGSAF